MLSIAGTYQNGEVLLDESYAGETPVKVIVTFLDGKESEKTEVLNLADFSFQKSRENLEAFKGSFADEVITERRSDL